MKEIRFDWTELKTLNDKQWQKEKSTVGNIKHKFNFWFVWFFIHFSEPKRRFRNVLICKLKSLGIYIRTISQWNVTNLN
jgi:hypothetical protein